VQLQIGFFFTRKLQAVKYCCPNIYAPPFVPSIGREQEENLVSAEIARFFMQIPLKSALGHSPFSFFFSWSIDDFGLVSD
jgi:hypothetical protein